jgi:hypothetical protein
MPDAHHERHFVAADGGLLYRLVVEYEPRAGLRGSTTGFSCGAVSSARFVEARLSIADELASS